MYSLAWPGYTTIYHMHAGIMCQYQVPGYSSVLLRSILMHGVITDDLHFITYIMGLAEGRRRLLLSLWCARVRNTIVQSMPHE